MGKAEIIYNTDFVTGWLRPSDWIGLNTKATYRRFESKIKAILLQCKPISEVRFKRVKDESQDWGIQIGTCPVPDHTAVLRHIHEQIINHHWLEYNSAQEHAEALANTPVDELQYTLHLDMADGYGIPLIEAHKLVQAAQEWSGIT
jgi:hypothetical protein